MKLSQLLYGTSIEQNNQLPSQDIKDISKDSRTVTEGMLFVALSEDRAQRHQHCKEAIAQGARMILCPVADHSEGFPRALFSQNPRLDYAIIAGNYFGNPSKHCVLVGVTGTNGKTTTTHIIKNMLESSQGEKQRKVGLIGTNEHKIGSKSLPSQRTTPDAYELQQLFSQMRQEGCTHIVMEVSSHALVQHRCGGLVFDVGIFTNLSQDHLDYHQNLEAYAKAKAQLFHQSKVSLFNLDDPVGRDLAQSQSHQGKTVLSYSENKKHSSIHASHLELHTDSIQFHCHHQGESFPVYLPIPGGFSLYNALAALCCAVALDIPLSSATQSLKTLQGVKGRAEIVPTDKDFTVMIDYAHSPNALENILLTARNFTPGRLICVFGCGGNRDKSKRAIMGEIAHDLADLCIVTSDNPRFEEPEEIIQDILQGMWQNKEKKVLPNRKDAIFCALSQGKTGDTILLAGKGHECYQEISGIQYHFDERELVEEYFSLQKKTSK